MSQAMKITHLNTLCLSRMHEPAIQWATGAFRVIKADCAIVVIETDAGITGIAEACAYGGPEQIRKWVAYYAPMLLGRDPLDPATPPAPHYKNWSHDCAVAGIDCALWDIRGKAAGKTVSQLLVESGASPRTEAPINPVRLYASSGCRYEWGASEHQLIEEALGYIDAGFTAMKLRIGTDWAWDGVTVDRFLGLMRELSQATKATGKHFDLALDGNQRLTEAQAMPIAAELERLGFAWFEEPIPQMDVDGYARIAASVEMPITGGEQFTTVEQFRRHFEKHAYDIAQPDMGWCGLSEGMRIVRMAEHYGIRILPHNWHNGLMTMANAHFVAALPHPYMCELCMIQGPLQWAILKNKPEIKDGHLCLPDQPGFGVELADDPEATFPYLTGGWGLPVQRGEVLVAG
jgi:L-alanine-DL-glutamate epimerase-like enolase superfamily enzyme